MTIGVQPGGNIVRSDSCEVSCVRLHFSRGIVETLLRLPSRAPSCLGQLDILALGEAEKTAQTKPVSERLPTPCQQRRRSRWPAKILHKHLGLKLIFRVFQIDLGAQ